MPNLFDKIVQTVINPHISKFYFKGYVFHSKYFSTLSRPQSCFTTGIIAGTGNSKPRSKSSLRSPPLTHFHEKYCFRASLMADLVAQCTEAAPSNGGSPEAASERSRRRQIQHFKES